MSTSQSASEARSFASRLGRRARMGAPVRRAFVTIDEGQLQSPMGSLMSSTSAGGGGRGGRTRLALLLSLLWVASAHPHTTSRSARWWAEILGLPDSATKGARSVSTNLHELDRRGFIRLEPGRRGYNSKVTLLNETPPHGDYSLPHTDGGSGYFRLSEKLWTQGLIGDLDGASLAMFVLLTYYYRADTHETDGVWFSPNYFKERHGLSDTTRNRGLQGLVASGAAHVQETFVDTEIDGQYRSFPRRVFRLDPQYYPPAPQAAP